MWGGGWVEGSWGEGGAEAAEPSCVDVCVHVWFAKGSKRHCFATKLRQIVLHGLSLVSQLPCLEPLPRNVGVGKGGEKSRRGWKEGE